MNPTDTLKEHKGELIAKYAKRNNLSALFQTLNTIIPYFVLFYLCIESLSISYWLAAGLGCLLILFIMRVFMMMHDSGHGCLYEKPLPNQVVGFIMGVLCGVPQHVWSKHHAYHHATNGNWNKYRGPLSVLSVDEYGKLSKKKQKSYGNNRNILLAPLGGFMYFIFSPRFTWIKGTINFVTYLCVQKMTHSSLSIKEIANKFETKYWNTWQEYFHMAANNLVLISAWILAANYFGAVNFFIVYVIVLSLSGALGIILFTVQHNFEDSYASGDDKWDYFSAAIEGTSYLDLPRVLHWFTADIGYHHIHHLSARIPNYKLEKCHREYAHLFNDVTRIKLKDVPEAFKYILWDNHCGRMISVAQYDAVYGQSTVEPTVDQKVVGNS
ncbi:MAG: fatty acid desaturase [Bermanella sp.]